MGFVKGTDGIARTVRNPLEGSVGDIALDDIITNTLTSTGNVTGGNLITVGQISATSTITSSANVVGGNVLTGGLISATGTITSAANVTGGNVLTGGLISATANVTGGNVLTGGNLSVATNASVTGNISGNVLYTPAVSGDWANAAAIYNVKLALDATANAVTILESGTGFTFLGPFSNDATAAAGGVAIGQVYFNNSGGLVVRQT